MVLNIRRKLPLFLIVLSSVLAIRQGHDKSKFGSTQLAQTGFFSDALMGFVGKVMDRGPPERKDYYRMKGLEANKGARNPKKLKHLKSLQNMNSSVHPSTLEKTLQVISPQGVYRHNLRSKVPYTKIKIQQLKDEIKDLEKQEKTEKHRENHEKKEIKQKIKLEKKEVQKVKRETGSKLSNGGIIMIKKDGRSIVEPLQKRKKHPSIHLTKRKKQLLKRRVAILQKMEKVLNRRIQKSIKSTVQKADHVRQIQNFEDSMDKMGAEIKENMFHHMKKMHRLAGRLAKTNTVYHKLYGSWMKNKHNLSQLEMKLERIKRLAYGKQKPKGNFSLNTKVKHLDGKKLMEEQKLKKAQVYIKELLKRKTAGQDKIPNLKQFRNYINRRIKNLEKKEESLMKRKKKRKGL